MFKKCYALACTSCFADLRNKWHLVIDRLTVLFLKFLEYFHKLQVFMWWILELHIIKIVSSYIIWVSVKEASEHFCPIIRLNRSTVGHHFPFPAVHDLFNVIPITLGYQDSKISTYTYRNPRVRSTEKKERGSWLSFSLAWSYHKRYLFSSSP